MLVITRGLYQTFKIGNNVTAKVLGFNHGPWGVSVRIGIEAPREVKIMRDDMKDRRPKSK